MTDVTPAAGGWRPPNDLVVKQDIVQRWLASTAG